MLFRYSAVDDKGTRKDGEIDAPNRDLAISGLQRRNLIIVSIAEVVSTKPLLQQAVFERVSMRDVVIISRQIATLFEAQVSALRAFTMLAANADKEILRRKLNQITDDIQAGVSISGALSKHPDMFSDFYVNMVRAGEETGKLDQAFMHLAEYLDRQYVLNSKTRNALIYPIFVVITFIVVISLMFTLVIPRLSAILVESGQEIPVYTRIIIAVSEFFVNYGFVFLIAVVLSSLWFLRLSRTSAGKEYIDRTRLSLPLFGDLYRRLFLSRISDNLNTMLDSGIPIVRSIDITADVVSSQIYHNVLKDVADGVKSGLSLSTSFEKHPEHIPSIMVQMIKVGEETGSLGQILKTMSIFYKREVDDAVDTLVSLIEPFMIIFLGAGVGLLLVSILLPIYNIAGSIN